MDDAEQRALAGSEIAHRARRIVHALTGRRTRSETHRARLAEEMKELEARYAQEGPPGMTLPQRLKWEDENVPSFLR